MMSELCTNCGGMGWLRRDVPYGHPHFGEVVLCDCTERKRRARVDAQHRTHFAALQSELGDLAHCTFSTFDAVRDDLEPIEWNNEVVQVDDQRRALRKALKASRCYANNELKKPWLYFYGSVGSGKSHLAAAVLSVLAERGRSVAYATSAEHFDYVRAGMSDDTASARFAALCHVDVLAIDELGVEAGTPWEHERLFTLINYRWRMHASTIITSNARIEAHDERIADRIRERATCVLLPVKSYRRRR